MNFDKAVILHGKPSKEKASQPGFDPTRANWLGWLSDVLTENGVNVISPQLTEPSDPNFQEYLDRLKGLERLFAMRGRTVLIAHSAAVGPALEWASLMLGDRDAVLGVAPWTDPNGRYPKMRAPVIKTQALSPRKGRQNVHIMYSVEDDGEAIASVRGLYETGVGVVTHQGLGHFATGNNLVADYPLENGLEGSTCPEIFRFLRGV